MSVRKMGRYGRLFAASEGALANYGDGASLSATDAIRHLEATFNYQPFGPKVDSPERRGDASIVARLLRRAQGDWSLKGMFYTSGTIGTACELDPVLKAAMSTKVAGSANTTVASGPTTTSATLTSPTGFTEGEMVLITVGSAKYARKVTDITGSVMTWTPALPSAPATGAAVKNGITYTLGDIAESLFFAKYLNDSFIEYAYGCVVGQMTLDFDANEEPRATFSGSMQRKAHSGGPSEPAGFTTVGGQPPSGMTASIRVGANQLEWMKASLDLATGVFIKNDAAGTSAASGYYMKGKRRATIKIDSWLEDPTVLYDSVFSGADQELLLQNGDTEGSIIAIHMPTVEFDIPNTPDGDDEIVHSFSGLCKGVNGNDEFTLGLL